MKIYKSETRKYRVLKLNYAGDIYFKYQSKPLFFLFFCFSWFTHDPNFFTAHQAIAKIKSRIEEDNDDAYQKRKLAKAKKEIL